MSYPEFLKSLETDGGKIIALFILLILILSVGLLLFMTGHTPAEAGRDALRESATLILGMLTGYLAPKSK